MAVCLLPGTEVSFEKKVEWRGSVLGMFSKTRTLGEKVARFRQLNTDKSQMHHDALEFPNGETVLLTLLYQGQHATVLQLPATSRTADEAQEPKRESLIA